MSTLPDPEMVPKDRLESILMSGDVFKNMRTGPQSSTKAMIARLRDDRRGTSPIEDIDENGNVLVYETTDDIPTKEVKTVGGGDVKSTDNGGGKIQAGGVLEVESIEERVDSSGESDEDWITLGQQKGDGDREDVRENGDTVLEADRDSGTLQESAEKEGYDRVISMLGDTGEESEDSNSEQGGRFKGEGLRDAATVDGQANEFRSGNESDSGIQAESVNGGRDLILNESGESDGEPSGDFQAPPIRRYPATLRIEKTGRAEPPEFVREDEYAGEGDGVSEESSSGQHGESNERKPRVTIENSIFIRDNSAALAALQRSRDNNPKPDPIEEIAKDLGIDLEEVKKTKKHVAIICQEKMHIPFYPMKIIEEEIPLIFVFKKGSIPVSFSKGAKSHIYYHTGQGEWKFAKILFPGVMFEDKNKYIVTLKYKEQDK